MKTPITILTFFLVFGFGAILISQAAPPMDQVAEKDLKAVPSSETFQTLDGKLLKIDGEFYVVEDFSGKEMRLHVNQDTLLLSGPKQPGDLVRAEITKSGHAISIQ